MIGRHFAGNSTVSRSVAETVYFLSAPGSWNPNSSDFWLKICSSLASKAFLPAIYKSKLDKWALTQDQKSPPPLVAPVIGGVFFQPAWLRQVFSSSASSVGGAGWWRTGRWVSWPGSCPPPPRTPPPAGPYPAAGSPPRHTGHDYLLAFLQLFWRKKFSSSAVTLKFWIVSIKLTNISQGKIKLHFTI